MNAKQQKAGRQPVIPTGKTLRTAVTRTGDYKLTKREIECLLWCGRGRTNIEIGKRLELSSRTVEHYLASAIRKIGARNRTEAVYIAAMAGILEKPEVSK